MVGTVSNLTVVGFSDTAITFDWDTVTDQYPSVIIYEDGSAEGTVTVSSTGHTASGLSAGDDVTLSLYGKYPNLLSRSALITARAMSAPSNLSGTDIGDKVATMTFNANGAASMRIERQVGSNTPVTVTSSDLDSYDGSGLSNGTDYKYRVAGLAHGRTTDYSPRITMRPMQIPSNLSVSVGDTAALITFASDGLSVRVEWISLGTPNVTAIVTGAMAQRYAASGLTNGSEYTYRMAGLAHGLTTSYSALTNLVPMATPVLVLDYQSAGTISISWAAIVGATKYVLQRKTGNGAYADVQTVDAPAVVYTDTGLTEAEVYAYRLRARNKHDQDTGHSNEVNGYAGDSFMVTVVGSGHASVSLSWGDYANADKYTVRTLDANGDPTGAAIGTAIDDLTGENNKYGVTVAGLSNGTTVTYGVVVSIENVAVPVTSHAAIGMPFSVSLSAGIVAGYDGYSDSLTLHLDEEATPSDGHWQNWAQVVSVSDDGSTFDATLTVLATTPDSSSSDGVTHYYDLGGIDEKLGYGSVYRIGGMGANSLTQTYLGGIGDLAPLISVVGTVSNLTVKSFSDTAITFDWDAVTDQYPSVIIYEDGSAEGTVTVSSTGHTASGLSAGDDVTLSVYGKYPNLLSRSAVIVARAMSAPSDLTGIAIGNAVSTMTFNANGAASMRIERQVGSNTPVTVTSTDLDSYDGSGLSNGTDYKYRVAGLAHRQTTGYSSKITMRPMQIPSKLSVSIGDASALITFASDGLSVEVERVSLGTPNSTATLTGALAQRYAASGLTNGSEYTFRVAGYAHGLTTPYSALTNLVAMATPVLVLDYQSAGTISISWAAIAGATKYVLQRKVGSGSYADVQTVDAPAVVYADTDLTDDTVHSYRLRARNKHNQDTGHSNGVNGYAGDSFMVTVVGSGNASVSLSWGDYVNASKYTVRTLDVNGDPTGAAIGTAIDDLTGENNKYGVTVAGLSNGTTVTYGVVVSIENVAAPVTSHAATVLPFSVSLSKSTVGNNGYGQTTTVDFESDHSDGFAHYELQLVSVSDDGSTYDVTLSVITATLTPDANSTAKYTMTSELGYGSVYRFAALGVNSLTQSYLGGSAVITGIISVVGTVSNLTVVGFSDTAITFDWDTVTDQYPSVIIYEDGSAEGTVTVSSTGHTASGLSAGDDVTLSLYGKYPNLLSRSALITARAMSAPSNLSGTDIGDKVATMTFNANGAASMRIERQVGSNTPVTVTSSDLDSYDGSGLSNGTDYKYRVAGLAHGRTTDYSPRITMRPMQIPSNLSVSVGDTAALITFASDGLSVRVEWISLGTPNVTAIVTGAMAQRYAASGLTNGSEYTYRMAGLAHGLTTSYSALTNLVPMATPVLVLDYQSAGTILDQLGGDCRCDEVCITAQNRQRRLRGCADSRCAGGGLYRYRPY